MCAAVAKDMDRDVRAVMTENMGSGAWARHGAAKLAGPGASSLLLFSLEKKYSYNI